MVCLWWVGNVISEEWFFEEILWWAVVLLLLLLLSLIILMIFNFILEPKEDFLDNIEPFLCSGDCCDCSVFECDVVSESVVEEILDRNDGLFFCIEGLEVALSLLDCREEEDEEREGVEETGRIILFLVFELSCSKVLDWNKGFVAVLWPVGLFDESTLLLLLLSILIVLVLLFEVLVETLLKSVDEAFLNNGNFGELVLAAITEEALDVGIGERGEEVAEVVEVEDNDESLIRL